jgi:energy-converting hydrogenase Eha subunit E
MQLRNFVVDLSVGFGLAVVAIGGIALAARSLIHWTGVSCGLFTWQMEIAIATFDIAGAIAALILIAAFARDAWDTRGVAARRTPTPMLTACILLGFLFLLLMALAGYGCRGLESFR